MEKQAYSSQMGTASVPKLLIQLSIPSILAILANNFYNIVDSIFVAQLNEQALTALSIAAPIQMLMAALGAGLAVGLNAVVSRGLGEQNPQKVRSAAASAIFIALCSYLLICLAQLLILEPFFTWQTQDAQIREYGITYLRICMLFSFGCMLQWVFDRLLIATGKTSLFMIALVSASVTNLILDPIFIFGWLGIPAMGIAGAAWATVIGQILGAAVSLLLNLFRNREIPLSFTFKPNGHSVAQILAVGIPTAVTQAMTSVAGMLVNLVLIGYSATAVAAYGICLKIQNMFLVVPTGINLALIPVVAYNHGAEKPERQKAAFRWGMIFSLGFMALAILVLELFPEQFLLLFNASPQMLEIGSTALRILAISMMLSVYALILGAVLQALGKGFSSMILTVARQVVFILPLLFLLRNTATLSVLWLAFPLAEGLGAALGLYLHKRKYQLFQDASGKGGHSPSFLAKDFPLQPRLADGKEKAVTE